MSPCIEKPCTNEQKGKGLLEQAQSGYKMYQQLDPDFDLHLKGSSRWEKRVQAEKNKFISNDGIFDFDVIRQFRKLQLLVRDRPECDYAKWFSPSTFFAGHWRGKRRGERYMLLDELEALERAGYGNLLKQYPSNRVGEPYLFEYAGYSYTFRWIHHVYYLGLLKQVLGDRLGEEPILMDIGSSYGVFPYLFHSEHPRSSCVLVDYAEHLVLAHYFLGMSYPGCKIAGPYDVVTAKEINREWIRRYDFVLVPCSLYDRMMANAVDLIVNFTSFSEMPIEVCRHYWNSPPFVTAKFFYTVGRVEAYPDYIPPITIMDFPLQEGVKRLHLKKHPMFVNRYDQVKYFWYRKVKRPTVFEYIGEQ